MRKLLIIPGLTALVFGVITFTTANYDSMSDGNDTLGFPLTYYIYFGGKMDVYPPDLTEIYYWKLVLDILFAAFVAVLGRMIFFRVKNRFIK
jgi:hypothetical protein